MTTPTASPPPYLNYPEPTVDGFGTAASIWKPIIPEDGPPGLPGPPGDDAPPRGTPKFTVLRATSPADYVPDGIIWGQGNGLVLDAAESYPETCMAGTGAGTVFERARFLQSGTAIVMGTVLSDRSMTAAGSYGVLRRWVGAGIGNPNDQGYQMALGPMWPGEAYADFCAVVRVDAGEEWGVSIFKYTGGTSAFTAIIRAAMLS
jgi:hypothetical protein